MYYLIKGQSCYHIENNQLICSENQLSGFYMMTALGFNELMKCQPKEQYGCFAKYPFNFY